MSQNKKRESKPMIHLDELPPDNQLLWMRFFWFFCRNALWRSILYKEFIKPLLASQSCGVKFKQPAKPPDPSWPFPWHLLALPPPSPSRLSCSSPRKLAVNRAQHPCTCCPLGREFLYPSWILSDGGSTGMELVTLSAFFLLHLSLCIVIVSVVTCLI